MTDPLAAFLLARIAEDEAAARAATPEIWSDEDQHRVGWVEDQRHVDRWNPARVLAECEAKRRIVDTYLRNRERIEANVAEHTRASNRGDLAALPTLRSAGWDLGGRDWALEMTLRLLALPYADHPDWREEWRP